MKKKLNLLVTCVGGDYGPEIIKRFKSNKIISDIKIIGIDNKKEVVANKFLDFYYVAPLAIKQTYVKFIDKIIEKHKINLVLATSDEESLILSKHLKNSDVVLACSDYESLSVVSNKIETYKLLQKYNIKTPIWREIINENNMIQAINFFKQKKMDFCVKPAVSRGGRDVYLIDNKMKKMSAFQGSREMHLNIKDFKKNFKFFFKNKYPLIMMEKLKAPVYDLDMLSNNGKLINSVCRRRIHSALPNSGHLIVKNKFLNNLAKKLSSIFNLNYLHDCDLMVDKNNNLKILEINPRPSGSFIVAEAAGYPLIENLLKIYLNKKNYTKVKKVFNKILPFQSLTYFDRK